LRRRRRLPPNDAQLCQGESRVPDRPALQDLAAGHETAGYSGQRTRGRISRGLSTSGPVQDDGILVDGYVVHGDMKPGKGGTVKGDAEFDSLRALDEIGDQTPVIDVGRSEQLIRKVEVPSVPYFIDHSLYQSCGVYQKTASLASLAVPPCLVMKFPHILPGGGRGHHRGTENDGH